MENGIIFVDNSVEITYTVIAGESKDRVILNAPSLGRVHEYYIHANASDEQVFTAMEDEIRQYLIPKHGDDSWLKVT